MSLRKTQFEFVTVQPRRVLLGGLFASLAVIAVVFGFGSTVAMSPTPAQACQSGCGNSGGDDNGSGGNGGDYGHKNDDDGHHDDDNDDNGGNCGGCGGGDDDDGGHDDDGHDDDSGGDTNAGAGNGVSSGNSSGTGDGDNDTYERLSREVNNYTRGNRVSSAHYNVLGDDFRGSLTRAAPRRVVVIERPRQVVRYVQPREARVIRPREVRELRPSYRTGYAVRAGRYENVVYTAPAVRYAAPVRARRVVYSEGYVSGRVPALSAYAARGRVGVRAVERRVRGRGVVRSLSAYAQGRNVRVSIGGSGRYGNVARRAYASESYVYADESGADIVYAGQRYRTTVYGGRYGSRGGLYDGAGNCEYRCF